MSIEHLNAALHLELTDPSCKSVLIGLANHANPESQCWPGIKRLMLYTGLSERAVRDALRRLEGLGYVSTVRRPQQTSMYFMHIGVGQQLPVGGRELPQGGAPAAPEPLSNHQLTDASDAREFDDDWKPADKTINSIMEKDGLSLAEIGRELRMFVLKCQAGKIPDKPDAAFKAWCARVKDLNHKPNAPPASAPSPPGVWDRAAKLANYRKTRELYEKMGRVEELASIDINIKELEDQDDVTDTPE